MSLFQQHAGSSNESFKEYQSRTSGESLERSNSDVQSKQTPSKADDESRKQSSSKPKNNESTEGNLILQFLTLLTF